MNLPTDANDGPSPVTSNQKVIGRLVTLLVFFWISAVTFALQGVAWLGPALGDLFSVKPNPAVLTLAEGIALSVPLLVLGLFWPVVRYRAIFRTWAAAAALVLALALTRLLPSTNGQTIILLQLAIVLVALALLLLFDRRKSLPPASWTGAAISLALATVFAYPWIAWGALGSALDLLLALGLGLGAGLLASLIVSRFWLASLQVDTRGPVHDFLTGGFVIGTMLTILASGLSFNGMQLVLMIALPGLGWAAMGLAGLGQSPASAANRRAIGLLLGLAIAAPMAFTDPDGLLLEAADKILGSAFAAAAISLVLSWLAGLIFLAASRSLARFRSHAAWPVVAGVLALFGVILYVTGGQAGWHGDRLFVILNDQADVSAAAGMQDYDARRQFVYDTLVEHAGDTQADLRTQLDKLHAGYTPYYLVNALEVRGGLPMQLWLSTRPEVDRVLPSPRLRPPQSLPQEARGSAERPALPDWNLTSIGADRVWKAFNVRGQGIVVGQSDLGVQFDHPELRDSYRGSAGKHDFNWLDPWYGSRAPYDAGGHGTHTLGSVLGNNVGVAPDATWIACANLYRNLGNPALYLDCMQFMLAPYPQDGDPFTDGEPARSANVLNNSWGCPQEFEGCDALSLEPAVAALRAAGIFVVASAGNSGPACGTITDPIALYDESFSVGAVDRQGNLAMFSSRGPVSADGSGRVKPDIAAPGVAVLSAYPGGTYESASGTSMAGPHVAGVVALLWSANPDLIGDIERTEQILIDSAQPFTGTINALPLEMGSGDTLPGVSSAATTCDATGSGSTPSNYAGYGIVDAYRAVKMALEGIVDSEQ